MTERIHAAAILPFLARRRIEQVDDLVAEADLDVPITEMKTVGLGAIGMVVGVVVTTAVISTVLDCAVPSGLFS
jgi:hypothetical protein